MIQLIFKNILYFIIQPGLVVGLIPYLLLRGDIASYWADGLTLTQYGGILHMVMGLGTVIYCIYRFVVEGRGTISPVDKTRKLVVKGLYKHTRNPMYVGVLWILLGEALFTASLLIFGYMIVMAIVFHLFVIYVEEPRLTKDFKSEYLEYMNTSRRWW